MAKKRRAKKAPAKKPVANGSGFPPAPEGKRGDKANAIRAALEGGITSPKEVVTALAAKGISVSSAMVSNMKGRLGKKKRKKKAKAMPGGSGVSGFLDMNDPNLKVAIAGAVKLVTYGGKNAMQIFKLAALIKESE